MLGKIILILGILGMLLGGAVVLICFQLLTDGRTSFDEALLGIIPGVIVLTGAFVLAVIGLIVVLMKWTKTTGVSNA
jgi:hypothetical protein